MAAVWRYEVELERGRPRLPSALLMALAWTTRPEAPAYLLYFLLRRPDRRWLGLLAALVVPYELFGCAYYGHLFPATHAAKVGGSGFKVLGAFFTARLPDLLFVRFFVDQGWGFRLIVLAGGVGAAPTIKARTAVKPSCLRMKLPSIVRSPGICRMTPMSDGGSLASMPCLNLVYRRGTEKKIVGSIFFRSLTKVSVDSEKLTL